MKNGILKRPSVTLCLRAGRLSPSKGRDPHTNTYRTTPRLCERDIFVACIRFAFIPVLARQQIIVFYIKFNMKIGVS